MNLEKLCNLALEGIKENDGTYTKEKLRKALSNIIRDNMSIAEIRRSLIQVSLDLTSDMEPNWQYAASTIYIYELYENIRKNRNLDSNKNLYGNYYEFIKSLTDKNLYGEYILKKYSKEDILELEKEIKPERDFLFNYSGIDLVAKRYLVQDFNRKVIELPQQMFMGIAMHLAIPEVKEKRVYWAKRFYNVLSELKATMATPTMSNARKPFYQLSSCFVDTVDDSLEGIYKSLDNFAKVSKFGGGMGLYIGKIRSLGAPIRGFKGASGGVIPWVKLFNDTAIAVDQLGVRNGSVAIYLDAWHKDIPEFLQIRTNNGDDRKKAHDVFPGVCYPDLFWKLAEENIDEKWYLMCPHEIKSAKGYSLEDYYGEEWEKKYFECVEDDRIEKRSIKIKDLVRLIIKSAAETGAPFAFFRDTANKMNPNKHKGIIYSSNLCTEIMQNMSVMKIKGDTIIKENDQYKVIENIEAGDFVVCNLSSLVLGNIDVLDDEKLEYVVETQIRAMDNVIDLNYYSVPFAEITNKRYRGIGLGTSGYHHMLANNKIHWAGEKHKIFVDDVYERINYYSIKASMNLSKEKGKYEFFDGSDWENGNYFELREYSDKKWCDLRKDVKEFGMRNGYLIAVAPNGSTATIAGTSEGIDPIMARFYLDEKKGMIIPKTAPKLSKDNFWYYNTAYNLEQSWCVEMNGVRQRHIDQGQSFNLYITTQYTMRQIMNLYIKACKCGVKSIYYVRSKSLEVTECESCSG